MCCVISREVRVWEVCFRVADERIVMLIKLSVFQKMKWLWWWHVSDLGSAMVLLFPSTPFCVIYNGWHLSRRCATLQNDKVQIPQICSGCMHVASAPPRRLIMHKMSLKYGYFSLRWMHVLWNLYFNNVCPRRVQFRPCAVENSPCDDATDAPPRLEAILAARCSFWHHQQVCVTFQTCKKPPQGYGIDSFSGKGFFL